MGIHDFGSPANINPANVKEQVQAPSIGIHRDGEQVPKENDPLQVDLVPKSEKKYQDLFEDPVNINTPESIATILPKGFYTFDRGIKNYFAGIRVPTNDNLRIMNIRIAGNDKSVLIWMQELKRGRVTLPIMSINRTNVEYNEQKFSYPYHAMSTRYNHDGSKLIKTYRPVPYLINYELSIWAEHKRDAEYATYQILTRFNPLAEFKVQDEYITGNVQLRYQGWSNESDVEIDAETRPNIRYTISCQMEAWLPLPEKVVPTILGGVSNFKESYTKEFLGNVDSVIRRR